MKCWGEGALDEVDFLCHWGGLKKPMQLLDIEDSLEKGAAGWLHISYGVITVYSLISSLLSQ